MLATYHFLGCWFKKTNRRFPLWLVKPGSHMPAKLNWVQLRRQADRGCRRFSAMQIFYVNIISNSICIRAKIEDAKDPSQMHRDPLKHIADRCQLQPATTSQAGGRDMRTRLYYNQELQFPRLWFSTNSLAKLLSDSLLLDSLLLDSLLSDSLISQSHSKM